MKRILLMLGLILSLNAYSQGNFFWSHSGTACRPTGLSNGQFIDYSMDTYIAGSWQDAFAGYVCWRDGYCDELGGWYYEYSSIAVGQNVYLGIGATNCDKIPDGYYLSYCSSDRYKVVQMTSGAIASIYNCFGEASPGYLYNWYAVNGDTDGDGTKESEIAPSGWHVPTLTEWTTLDTYLTNNGFGYGGSGNDVAYSIAATTTWTYSGVTAGSPGYNQSTNNSSGFTMFAVGIRGSDGVYISGGSYGMTWTTTASGTSRYITYITNDTEILYSNHVSTQATGIPIRLIKDNSTDPCTVTDYDGNKYPTVKIGNQVWMASNLKTQHYSDGVAIPEVTNGTTWAALTTGARCSYNNDDTKK